MIYSVGSEIRSLCSWVKGSVKAHPIVSVVALGVLAAGAKYYFREPNTINEALQRGVTPILEEQSAQTDPVLTFIDASPYPVELHQIFSTYQYPISELPKIFCKSMGNYPEISLEDMKGHRIVKFTTYDNRVGISISVKGASEKTLQDLGIGESKKQVQNLEGVLTLFCDQDGKWRVTSSENLGFLMSLIVPEWDLQEGNFLDLQAIDALLSNKNSDFNLAFPTVCDSDEDLPS